MQEVRVRIPQLVDIGEAILIYYAKTELSNADLKTLFGTKAESTYYKLKKLVRNAMKEKNIEVFDDSKVNTKLAFEVWGFDINELEANFKKISKIRSMM